MRLIQPHKFIATEAWQAMDIETFENATVRLHWTDKPYKWHINDGPEVFVVLDGTVDMHTRSNQGETIWNMEKGDIFHADAGDEHVAHPLGVARILVIEKAGSV